MNIIKIIKEEKSIILEKLYHFDDDIDLIYINFFKEDLEKIQKNDFNDVFEVQKTDSSIFRTEKLKEAHKLNPVKIIINDLNNGNAYYFFHKILKFGIDIEALNIAKEYGSVNDAANDMVEKIRFKKEFTEEKIKTSIAHEITHWLDDTYTKVFNKKMFQPTSNYRKDNYDYFENFEINTMIHAIKELKRIKNPNLWNRLTFDDLMKLTPQLIIIQKKMNRISQEKYLKWKRQMLTRMGKENLLGDSMKYK